MNIKNYLIDNPKIKTILGNLKYKISKSCDEFNMMLIASDFYSSNKSLFIVLPTLYQAQKYYDSLSNYMDEADVLFFPADELVSAEMIAATGDFLFERIQTIYTLLTNEKKIVITNLHGALKYELPKQTWLDSFFNLSKGQIIDPKELCNKLVKIGYEPVFTVTKTGEFARRGSIIDIFPLGSVSPYRLDFFDDEIDTIKEFNPDSQRSGASMSLIDILPVTEFIYTNEEFNNAEHRLKSYLDNYSLSIMEENIYKKDLSDLEDHKGLNRLSRYLMFFSDDITNIFSFAEHKKIYFIDPIKSNESYNHLLDDLKDYTLRIGGNSIKDMKLFIPFTEVLNQANYQIESVRSLLSSDIEINAHDIDPYKGNPKLFIDDIINQKTDKYIVVSISDERRLKRLTEVLMESNIYLVSLDKVEKLEKGNVYYTKEQTPAFLLDELMLINEDLIFSSNYKPKKVKYKSIYKNAVKISKYDELELGDYVVHYDYGIGRYNGIKTIKTGDIERDYINIEYAEKSSLNIPLEQISNIMKYASSDVEGVKINSIGGTSWARTKAKVRNRVRDISQKLISIYSARQNAKGFSFPPDSEEQELFEADFEYDLTADQAKAVYDVKTDMESSRPMDRLVCGDVGYGKTEVALRAAFKAVYGGKQVSVLAPTTILSRQHYLTFKNRMEKYGIRVELLNRFVPSKKQEEIISDIRTGSVDVVIGTHRILSHEIVYYDLGLLIIDEEQRFGVTHKERIKELKVDVDCITLSATPIPRTLQMSVMGLKDLSMIETPPKNRYPIQTYIIERNDRIITDAIERELARGGQVFYLYNRVDTIIDEEAKLHSLVPEAKIAVAHGRLTKDRLEKIIQAFVDHEYDILLCTTIIETGIDMPDTNTLLIHDADKLGLSQMYQIRGRVGRSNKIAYAYLMYEPRKMLTPEAEKRLETISEFNELGSGFKIAMRDLSIRGSGDLLGEEQSGFVETVGIDMYLKILDEEIHHKGEQKEIAQDKSMLIPLTSRTIRTSYINNDDARIMVHKRIDKLKCLNDVYDLITELEDRFGKVDNDLLCYIYEKLLKAYCKKLDIYKLDRNQRGYLILCFTKAKTAQIDGSKMFSVVVKYKGLKLTSKDNEIKIMVLTERRQKLDYFIETCNCLAELEVAI